MALDNITFGKTPDKHLNFLQQPTKALPEEETPPTQPPTSGNYQEPPPPESGNDALQDNEPEPETQTISDDDANETADGFIWLVDFFQDIVFRWLAKRKVRERAEELFPEEGLAKLKEVIANIKRNGTTLLQPKEAALRDLNDAVEDFLKELPFEEWEKDKIRKPLAQLTKAKGVKMSPGMQLMVSVGMIMASRIAAFRDI